MVCVVAAHLGAAGGGGYNNISVIAEKLNKLIDKTYVTQFLRFDRFIRNIDRLEFFVCFSCLNGTNEFCWFHNDSPYIYKTILYFSFWE